MISLLRDYRKLVFIFYPNESISINFDADNKMKYSHDFLSYKLLISLTWRSRLPK